MYLDTYSHLCMLLSCSRSQCNSRQYWWLATHGRSFGAMQSSHSMLVTNNIGFNNFKLRPWIMLYFCGEFLLEIYEALRRKMGKCYNHKSQEIILVTLVLSVDWSLGWDLPEDGYKIIKHSLQSRWLMYQCSTLKCISFFYIELISFPLFWKFEKLIFYYLHISI